jgi:DNA mismatch repair ATPase MutS
MKYEVISKEQFKELIKQFKAEIRELDKLVADEESIADALYEFLKYQKNSDYIRYNLEKLLKELEEDERFKLGILLILSSFYPFGFNLRQSFY